ncbi:import inner membrane translocase subunit Tim9 [Salpingoeca rosetta]|uniref:Mitochondrial import inner membrane translocase subunit n=1 Tax=Salpingoeca rosetta (strain ATCC 50818 / BSB-021) TaxID=946362 RepID=F2TXM6_SALR5|nr:import inner membrane translocase subunit Tim9 [Salpingoeca rosetta]EGD76135.1 import inner membrane translocase subunit Tim9 [Salpingoeca rosetta]|eukprot:XP_004998310.1 import inner membrane translocase subunit Tim9 [Salpingoeca rosetta]
MDLNQLPPEQRAQIEAQLQRRQVSDFISLYNRLTEQCFNACCNEFTSRKLTGQQKSCVENCVGKFFVASQRIGQRFQEAQAHAATMAQQGM